MYSWEGKGLRRIGYNAEKEGYGMEEKDKEEEDEKLMRRRKRNKRWWDTAFQNSENIIR